MAMITGNLDHPRPAVASGREEGDPGFMVVITELPRPGEASGILNDSGRYDSSSVEDGVLVAHHRVTARPPLRNHWWRD
ncbi:hypothetical protein AVEN_218936-1 [Araneus ventricosus]|uniref:Uncharacterized protein n=1 Tax=Araneus ventricosus TaxID=182803 RepID=A0A4Y2H3I2_ARAVE|nr:hypothetical protein AVEN_218936-1 [Araneus ventricosus]